MCGGGVGGWGGGYNLSAGYNTQCHAFCTHTLLGACCSEVDTGADDPSASAT